MATVEGINIDLDAVNAAATTIRNLNTNLTTNLTTVKSEINSLSSTWQSDAGDTIQKKINGMQVHFDDYQKIIESYAKFLEKTVQEYRSMETGINTNASSFQ